MAEEPPKTIEELQALEQKVLKQAERDIERYRKSDALIKVVDKNGKPLRGAQVEVQQISHDFLFGCNFYAYGMLENEQNEEYARAFVRLFNYATLPFYWRSFEPQPGQERWERIDRMVERLERDRVRMKGHPLIWFYEQCYPDWARKPYQEVEKLLERRIRRIVSRYKGRITYWDVLNEEHSCKRIEGGFELNFDQMVDLAKKALQWVKEEEPTAYCVINDYNIIGDINGEQEQYKFLAALTAVDAPFDAIGMQAHFIERVDYWTIAKTIEKYSELGKPIHLTEVTPMSKGDWGNKYYRKGEWTEETQAEFVKGLYTVAFSKPAVEAITWWDLCDARTWQKSGGLLRADLSPKPAYRVLDELINHKWKTDVEGRTNVAGAFRFRGFYGKYEVTIHKDGKEMKTKIHISKDNSNIFTIKWQ